MISERSPSQPSPLRAISAFLETWGGVAAIILIAAICAMVPSARESFFKPENIRNIFNQYSYVGIIAVGMTLVIMAGGIDLSVGSLLALVGGLAIMAGNAVMKSSGSEWLGVATAFVVAPVLGTAAGWLNGILVTKGRIAPFIVTLGGLAGFRSIILGIAHGGEIRSSSTGMFEVLASPRQGIPIPGVMIGPEGHQQALHVTWPIIVFIVTAIAAQVLLSRTRLGRHIVAVGANERAARYSAINVDRVRIFTYTIIGFLTGVSALLLASRMNSIGSSNAGNFYELDAIAAVVIGGTRMSGGKGRVWGTFVGIVLLGIIDNVLLMMQVNSEWQGLVKAGVIIAAVLIQRSDNSQ